MNIKQVDFPYSQYYRRKGNKKQIVLHHTVSGEGISGDVSWWIKTPERIAAAYIISRDGTIYQNFDDKYWAHHLGVKSKVFEKHGLDPKGANAWLNINSIGIELDSWGGLKELNEHGVVDFVEYEKKYRGFKYFEAYTKRQIEELGKLLVYLCDKYGITKEYKSGMWRASKKALSGESGIWSHTSFRSDKSDCHPQPTLIQILKQMNNG